MKDFREIIAWLWIILIIMAVILVGCASITENWKRDPETGEMVLHQRLKAKGLGDTKARFEDKSEIESKAYKPIPQLPIEDIKVGD